MKSQAHGFDITSRMCELTILYTSTEVSAFVLNINSKRN